MTPEAQLIHITDAMAAALARHGCYPAGSAIRSVYFAGRAAEAEAEAVAIPDPSMVILHRENGRLCDEIQLLRLKIQELHDKTEDWPRRASPVIDEAAVMRAVEELDICRNWPIDDTDVSGVEYIIRVRAALVAAMDTH